MRNWVWLCAAMALLVTGCSRAPIKTKEIHFYRQANVNGGKPIQVDVVYPRSEAERNEIWQTTADTWYGSHPMFDKVVKQEFDVRPCQGSVGDCSSVLTLDKTKKTKQQQWLIVIAELGPKPEGQSPSLAQKELIYLDKIQKPKKREYFRIHQGWIERLERKPR